MTITIRTATADDSELIRDLGACIFTETFAEANTPENMRTYIAASFSIETVEAEVRDPASTHLLAEADGTPAGYARLRSGEAPSEVGSGRVIELVRLYVNSAHHGTGVAAALMLACLDHARTTEHDVMYLGVWEHNPRAIAFYRKWGFEQVGTQSFVLGDDEQTDWLMLRRV